MSDIPTAKVLNASAIIFETRVEVDAKFAKFADNQFDDISKEVNKWFKRLAVSVGLTSAFDLQSDCCDRRERKGLMTIKSLKPMQRSSKPVSILRRSPRRVHKALLKNILGI